MDPENYFTWNVIENTVEDRLQNNSLAHLFSAKVKINKSTKLINSRLKKFKSINTYKKFVKCKKNILKTLIENDEVTDDSDINDTDYEQYYQSIGVHCLDKPKKPISDKRFQWIVVKKKGLKEWTDDDLLVQENTDNIVQPVNNSVSFRAVGTGVQLNIIQMFHDKSQTDLKEWLLNSTVKSDKNNSSNKCNAVAKYRKVDIKSTCKKKKSTNKLNKSPLRKRPRSKMTSSYVPSSNDSSNEASSSEKSGSEDKSESELLNSPSKDSPTRNDSNNESDSTSTSSSEKVTPLISVKDVKKLEKITTRKRPKDIKRNLKLAIDSVNLKTLNEDDWNEEFLPSDFQAQSTQICSETFSENNNLRRTSSYKPLTIYHKLNQPKDSGIEEDSKDECTKSKRLEVKKKLGKKIANNFDRPNKINSQRNSSDSNMSLEKIETINNHDKIQSKLPVKIIGEETLVKKYKIVKDCQQLKSIRKESFVSPSKENKETVSNDKIVTDYNSNSDNTSDSDVINESEHENNSSLVNLKNNLKRCKSPHFQKQYKELKRLKLIASSLEDSEHESVKESKQKNKIGKNKNKKSNTPKKTTTINNKYTNDEDFSEESHNSSQNVEENKEYLETIPETYDENSDSSLTQEEKWLPKTKQEKLKKKEKVDLPCSWESSCEIQSQNDLANCVDEFKENLLKSGELDNHNHLDDGNEEENDISPKAKEQLNKKKKLDLFNNSDSEKSEKEDIVPGSQNILEQSVHNHLDDGNEEENDISPKAKEQLNKKKKLDLFNNSDSEKSEKEDIVPGSQNILEQSVDSKKKQKKGKKRKKKNSYNGDVPTDNVEITCSSDFNSDNIEKHKIELSDDCKDIELSLEVSDSNSNHTISNNKTFEALKTTVFMSKKNDKDSNESFDIDVEHFSSENEIVLHKVKQNNKSSNNLKTVRFDKDDTEINKELDDKSDNKSDRSISPTEVNNISKRKKIDLYKDSSSEEDNEKLDLSNAYDYSKLLKSNILTQKQNRSSNSNEEESDVSDINANNSPSQSYFLTQKPKKSSDSDEEESNVSDSNANNCPSQSNILTQKQRKSTDSDEEESIVSDSNANNSPSQSKILTQKQKKLSESDKEEFDKSNSNVNSPSQSYFLTQKQKNSSDSDEEVSNSSNSNDPKVLENFVTQKPTDSIDSEFRIPNPLKATKNTKSLRLKKEALTSNLISQSTMTMKNLNKCEVALDNNKVHDIADGIHKNKEDNTREPQECADKHLQNLVSQDMFSSLENLAEGINNEKLIEEITSDASNKNSTDRAASKSNKQKKINKKIRSIPELLERDNLSEGTTYTSTLSLNNISADEEMFILEIPKFILDKNLKNKKFSFSKAALTIGDHKYAAYQKWVEPKISCVLKTSKNADNSFQTHNIRPSAYIVVRGISLTDDTSDTDIKTSKSSKKEVVNNKKNKSSPTKNHEMPETSSSSSKTKSPNNKKVENGSNKKLKKIIKKTKLKKYKFSLQNFVKMESKKKKTQNLCIPRSNSVSPIITKPNKVQDSDLES